MNFIAESFNSSPKAEISLQQKYGKIQFNYMSRLKRMRFGAAAKNDNLRVMMIPSRPIYASFRAFSNCRMNEFYVRLEFMFIAWQILPFTNIDNVLEEIDAKTKTFNIFR